jgi:hypothetical protein
VREDKGGKLLENYDEVIERKLLKRMKKEKKGIMRTIRKKQQRRRMEDEIIYRVGEDLKTRQDKRRVEGDGEFSGVRSSIPC